MSTHIQRLTEVERKNNPQECVFDSLLTSELLPPHERSVSRLKGEGQTLIGAGTLTTAHALKTIVFHTLNNPDLYRALVQELVDAFPSAHEPLPLSRLEKLPLLTAYITEGLRLAYGVSHRLQLLCQEELRVGDHLIPPGTPVGMSSVFMHNNPDVFPSPRTFDPGRWLDPEMYQQRNRHLVPFSKGTRMCLGMHLAWAELYMVLATVFRRYSVELHDTTVADVEMEHDFFDPMPKVESEGLRVLIRHREIK
jgi:cytochrome P450